VSEVPIPTPSGLKPGDPWVKKWAVAARLPFLTASVTPVLAATAAAAWQAQWQAQGAFLPWHAALAAVGVAFVHAGANLANDYFDHLSGNDAANRLVTPFSGGSRVIQEGILSARAILLASLACLAAGAACGIVLWLRTGHALLAIGLAGLAVGWCYSAPPLRLSHRGLGELAVAVAFGPLPVLGAEYVQRGQLSLKVGWLGVPAGLLVAAILLANEFPDVDADSAAGKRTLVVRLGRQRAALVYELLVLAAYASVCAGVLMEWMPPLAAAVVLAAPLSRRAMRGLRTHPDDVRALLPVLKATIAQQAVFMVLLTGAYLASLALRMR
jgi:1,4-dihydroxy-2-naphthoate octaprenyltransferase